jgi:phosphoribosylformylglycinamidine (FGAM) synthase PurS component
VLHTIAIKLKIPDNTAYSALTALRRLGVDVAHVERADIWQFEDAASSDEVAARVQRNESLFNPNKHTLEVLASPKPRPGETWIATICHREVPNDREAAPSGPERMRGVKGHFVSYRLFGENHNPASQATVEEAIEKLLCNPAIERAIT